MLSDEQLLKTASSSGRQIVPPPKSHLIAPDLALPDKKYGVRLIYQNGTLVQIDQADKVLKENASLISFNIPLTVC
jgi:hypothetical protein